MPGAKAVAIAIGIANGITGKIIAEMGNGRGGRAACIFSIAGVIAKARLNRQRFAQLGVCRAISVAIRPGNRLSVGKPLIAHRRRHALIIANDGVQDFPYFKIALNNNLRIARHRRGSDDEVKMCRLGIGVIGQIAKAVGRNFYADIAGAACGIGGGVSGGSGLREIAETAAARANIISRKALHGFAQGEGERGACPCG